MTAEIVVPGLVAIIGGLITLYGVRAGQRSNLKAVSEQAARDTLDDVWEQRVTFRDEQIAALKAQVAALTDEVKKLTGRIQSQEGAS